MGWGWGESRASRPPETTELTWTLHRKASGTETWKGQAFPTPSPSYLILRSTISSWALVTVVGGRR